MPFRSFLRVVFRNSGPRRAQAEAIDEQRRVVSFDLTQSRYRQREAIRQLLDETLLAIERIKESV